MLQAPIYSLRLILGNLRAYQNRDLPLTQKKSFFVITAVLVVWGYVRG